jgi:citrate lyase subunit beta/citryl-CoA lyase
MTAAPPLTMRSWLFAPGDSDRKMTKAVASAADVVLLDLEDAVTPANKPVARTMIHDFLQTNAADRARIWVRVNPLDGPHTLTDLAVIMPARPGGIMLPKVSGRQDVERLDHYLSAFEAAHGIPAGSMPVIVLVTETAESMFHTGDYKNAPRVVALTWGAEDLADSIGAASNCNADGSYSFTYELARSMCLLGAASAGVTAIETIQADFRDRGMLAIHPAQVDVINAAFAPTADDVAEAQQIVELFAANPNAGTIAFNGGMLDRPHLSRAQRMLEQFRG